MKGLLVIIGRMVEMTPGNSIRECAWQLRNDDFGYSKLFISGGGDKNLHRFGFVR